MKPSACPFGAGGGRALTKVVLGIGLIGALGWPAMPVCGADRAWTGDSSSHWSDPNNWYPVGVPQTGEALLFYDNAALFGPDPMVNDLPDLVVYSLTFDILSQLTMDWSLSGNPLNVTREIVCTGNAHFHINCGLKLAGDCNFDAGRGNVGESDDATELYLNGPIDLNGHALKLRGITEGTLVVVSGVISGFGYIHIYDYHSEFEGYVSDSSVRIEGAEGNTFHGGIFLHAFTYSWMGIPFITTGPHLLLHKHAGVAVNGKLQVESGGIVTLGNHNQLGADTIVTLQAGAKLLFNDFDQTAHDLVLTNFHADSASTLVDTGTGTLTLMGGISSWVDNNQGALPTIKGRLNLPAVFVHSFDVFGFDYAGLDIQAQIVGEGGFYKLGEAALLLEASNSFNGEITVAQGVLDVRDNHALGSTDGGVTLSSGGSLTLRNATIVGERLLVQGNRPVTVDTSGSLLFTVGTCVWSGPIVLNTNLAVFADNTFLTGPITGIGGLDLRNGTVQLAGPDANTFSGTTLVRGEALQLNKSSGVRAFGGPLVVGAPGVGGPSEVQWLSSYQNSGAPVTLFSNAVIDLNNFYDDFGTVTINGGRVETGSGQLAIHQSLTANAASVTAYLNGNLNLPGFSPLFFNVDHGLADPDLLVNANILGGAPDLIKQGPGTMRLSGNNTYTGVTVADQGVLQIDNSGSLGSGANPVVVHSNATLRLGIFGAITKPLFLSGDGAGGEGAVSVINGGSWTVTGFVLLDAPASIRVGVDAGLSILGDISGTGPLTKLGPGNLVLGGTANNTFTGDTVVNAGILTLAKSPFVQAIPANVIIGSGDVPGAVVRHAAPDQIWNGATVNRSSTLDLNNYDEYLGPLTLNAGGNVRTGTGILYLPTGVDVTVNPANFSASTISGHVGLGPGQHHFIVSGGFTVFGDPGLNVTADISQMSNVPADLIKDGTGVLRLAGANTYSGNTIAASGTLWIDGAQPQSPVRVTSGATLQGTGMLGQVAFNGILAPGSGSGILAPANLGILTCGDVGAGGGTGTLQVQMNGLTPGSGYAQVNASGTVNLAGLSLNAFLNFASAVGNQFTIINSSGINPIVGTFTGLREGANCYFGGQQFTISYTGGTGNDVVLTRIPTPPFPQLVIQPLPFAFVRLVWPTNSEGFSLQSKTNLNNANWTVVTLPSSIAGTNNIVFDSTTNSQRFYRLFHQ
jgi:autotransporter-associated beta strand protein